MNIYQSVFLEKIFFENIRKKSSFDVINVLYLPFLIRTMTPKIILKNLGYMCYKSVEF